MISLAYLDYIQSRPRYKTITSVPNPPHQTWFYTQKKSEKISEDQGDGSAGNSCYASPNS